MNKQKQSTGVQHCNWITLWLPCLSCSAHQSTHGKVWEIMQILSLKPGVSRFPATPAQGWGLSHFPTSHCKQMLPSHLQPSDFVGLAVSTQPHRHPMLRTTYFTAQLDLFNSLWNSVTAVTTGSCSRSCSLVHNAQGSSAVTQLSQLLRKELPTGPHVQYPPRPHKLALQHYHGLVSDTSQSHKFLSFPSWTLKHEYLQCMISTSSRTTFFNYYFTSPTPSLLFVHKYTSDTTSWRLLICLLTTLTQHPRTSKVGATLDASVLWREQLLPS